MAALRGAALGQRHPDRAAAEHLQQPGPGGGVAERGGEGFFELVGGPARAVRTYLLRNGHGVLASPPAVRVPGGPLVRVPGAADRFPLGVTSVTT